MKKFSESRTRPRSSNELTEPGLRMLPLNFIDSPILTMAK